MEQPSYHIENLFTISEPYDKYDYLLSIPLDADHRAMLDKRTMLENPHLEYQFRLLLDHEQRRYYIEPDNIKCYNNKIISLKGKIESLFFIYTDFGDIDGWSDKYWFFIGKTTYGMYFAYEVSNAGTGFGLGEESVIHFSKSQELLCKYGLTNKQRELIKNNIDNSRFKIDELDIDFYK